MKIKRRVKSKRFRGSQTARRGHKARTRGSGNQGGKGWSGTGKRGKAKKTLVIRMTGGGNTYFGASKTLRRGTAPIKLQVINLDNIEKDLARFVQNGIAKAAKGGYELTLTGYKILGDGEVSQKLHITATRASASAKNKIEKAGGSLALRDNEENEKFSDAKAAPEEEKKASASAPATKAKKAPAAKK